VREGGGENGRMDRRVESVHNQQLTRRRKAAGILLERREVRLKAIEIGNDRVREALDELAKTPCVWRSHCVSEHFNTHFTRFGQSTIDESLLFTGHEGGKHD